MTRPNVLLVTIDQLRADAIFGALGAGVPLPNLRRLAAEGVTFANHFTVTVPCGPARASLLTGLYAMNHRVIRNGVPLAGHHSNLAREARKAGYEPLLFGYTDVQADPSERAPGDPDLRTYEGVLPGFRELLELRFDSPRAWPAFLAAQGYELPEDFSALWRPVAAEGAMPQVTDPAFYRAEHSDTAFLVDGTLAALDIRRNAPWFAHVTFIRPHPPLVAPAPYNILVDPDSLPPPVDMAPDHPLIDAWFSEPCQTGLFYGFDGHFQTMQPETAQQLRAIYLGLLAEVDLHLGRLLDWLETTGQAGRTLVIVTGDHGDVLGDHGLWGKDSPFDPAFHVPLIIRDPAAAAAPGTLVEAITESVDIAPTILTALGREPPPAMDGRPLQPLLAGEIPDDWRDAAFAEIDFSGNPGPSRFQKALGLGVLEANATVLRETVWKLVHFNGGLPPLLFNLEADPDETTDLADDPEFEGQISRLRGKMLDRRMARAFRRLTEWSPEPDE